MQSVKTICLLVVVLLCKPANSQAVNEGEVIATPYIAIMPVDFLANTGLWRQPKSASFIGSPASLGITIERFSPTNKRNKINSFGVNFEYAYIGYKQTQTTKTQYFIPNTGNYYTITKESEYRRVSEKFRIMFNINHSFIHTEKQSSYFTIAIGYKKVKRWQISNGVRSVPEGDFFDLAYTIIPIDLRLGFGSKYLINENIIFSFDAGLGGGAPFRFGLGFKL